MSFWGYREKTLLNNSIKNKFFRVNHKEKSQFQKPALSRYCQWGKPTRDWPITKQLLEPRRPRYLIIGTMLQHSTCVLISKDRVIVAETDSPTMSTRVIRADFLSRICFSSHKMELGGITGWCPRVSRGCISVLEARAKIDTFCLNCSFIYMYIYTLYVYI